MGIEFIEEDDILIPIIVYRKGKQWLRPLEGNPFVILRPDEEPLYLFIQSAKRTANKITFSGETNDKGFIFQIKGSFEIKHGLKETIQTNIQIKLKKGINQKIQFQSSWSVQDTGIPRWMVPGIFYKHNRPPGCITLYPAYNPNNGDHKLFVSDHWFFRSDRSTHPSVFCWTKNYSTALIWNSINNIRVRKPNPYGLDDTGVGFSGNKAGTNLYLTFPYSEKPVKHSGTGRDSNYHDFKGIDAEIKFITMNQGDEIQLEFQIYAGDYDLHAYDPIIRDVYNQWRDNNPPNPWMSKQQASELTAYSLINWHYDEKEHVLYETCTFDSYFGKGKKQVDRPHMHVSWVSGAPYAFAMLAYAKRNILEKFKSSNPDEWLKFTLFPLEMNPQDFKFYKKWKKPIYEYADQAEHILMTSWSNKRLFEAAINVFDKITKNLTPVDFYYPEWTKEKGWGTGWNPSPHWIQARTIAEATLFILRSYWLTKHWHYESFHWIFSAFKNLSNIVNIQRKDGNLGSYYDLNTGAVVEWEGAGGMSWIPALITASKEVDIFSDSASLKHVLFVETALKAAQYYKKFVEDDYIYGAPEDVHLCPTSEDAYNAVMAYVAVYEETGDKKWLEIAKRAADLMETHRFAYNVTFPKHTILEKYDYRTMGGDIASPSNQHIHNYGMICTPEILKLWEWTEDDYYIDRLKDNLFCFHQFIARRDGDFGAMKGMVTERWFHTDWDHAKGDMLQLAHSWCAGLILYSNLSIHEFGDILVNLDTGKVHVLESMKIKNLKKSNKQISFILENPYDMNLILNIGVYHLKGKVNLKLDNKLLPEIDIKDLYLAINPKKKTIFSIELPANAKSKVNIGNIA